MRHKERLQKETEKRNRARRRRFVDWRYYGLVPVERVRFALEELTERLGPVETARRLQVSPHTLYCWRTGKRKRLHKEYAARVLVETYQVRLRDERRIARGKKRPSLGPRILDRDARGRIRGWQYLRQE